MSTQSGNNKKIDSAKIDLSLVDAIRDFNRFYTRQLGWLEESLLSSQFSLTEARILYELACCDEVTASQLAAKLGLDAGYLSRILKKFETKTLITRQASSSDARQSQLSLTRQGKTAFEPLEKTSREQITALLSRLDQEERKQLLQAMNTIERLLSPDSAAPAVPYMLRPHQPGDMGMITHRQSVLYNSEYGWDESYEALVSEITGQFITNFDARYERCWIAEREGVMAGSVFLIRESEEIAKLRLLYVEPKARGLGIGRRLVEECVRFAKQKNYKKLTLWTNDVLVAARHIYISVGFKLVNEEKHHSFGKDLVGQFWELDL